MMRNGITLSFLRPVHLLCTAYIVCIAIVMSTVSRTAIPWDAAIYGAMGKFIASGGHIGLWEFYRPPLLPLLLSIGPLFGLSVIIWGQVLTIGACGIALFLLYKIGERIGPYIGGIAAVLLTTAAFVTDFAVVPTTEIFGITLLLATLYFWQRNQFLLLGLFAALACLVRFPYGLLIPLYGACMLYFCDTHLLKKQLFAYALGVLIPLTPFFITNAFFYGSVLAPITQGREVANALSYLYLKPWYFYILILIAAQPFILFSFLGIQTILKRDRVILWFITLVFFIYFTLEPHKEDRYIIPALIPLLLFTGAGIETVWRKKKWVLCTTTILLGVFVLTNPYHADFRQKRNRELEEEYKSFTPGTVVLSSNPFPALYSNVRLIPAYESWEQLALEYTRHKREIERIYVDPCDFGSSSIDSVFEPLVRLELTTFALQKRCSTN
jgi:hypothetical protein